MNYRHAFHAGNFADVVKHSLLLVLLEALNRKPAPWCYLDTHAGAGGYDLTGEAARRTGEAAAGIERLWRARPETPWALAELVRIVGAMNPDLSPDQAPRWYPGSPAIAAAAARSSDRLVLAELQPEEAALLKAWFRRDGRVMVHARDGYEMLKALTPPKEKRGLVLLDPPYEQPQEFDVLVAALLAAHARWPGGCYALWYPLKDEPARRRFLRRLEHSGLRKLLLTELRVEERADALAGSGLLIVNPPWQTEGSLRECLQALAKLLASNSGQVDVHWLVPE
jgi:23S rRNA (adenine2030-N6)-methyltransferase